jgi:hypothetical protein
MLNVKKMLFNFKDLVTPNISACRKIDNTFQCSMQSTSNKQTR